jgi:hypothetical protein
MANKRSSLQGYIVKPIKKSDKARYEVLMTKKFCFK